MVVGVLALDKVLDDPVGALSAHGLAGIWGTLSCGIFTAPRYAELNAVGDPGLMYSDSFHQLGAQAEGIVASFAFVFVARFTVFWLIKETIGLRVHAEEEEAGLDIIEHGMYGYPELFIPPEEGDVPAMRDPGRRAAMSVPATGRERELGSRMKKIEAFIRHEAFEPIRMELLEKGFPSLSVGSTAAPDGRRGSPSTTAARS